MPIILSLERPRKEDRKFEASLNYIGIPFLTTIIKTSKKKTKSQQQKCRKIRIQFLQEKL